MTGQDSHSCICDVAEDPRGSVPSVKKILFITVKHQLFHASGAATQDAFIFGLTRVKNISHYFQSPKFSQN